MSRVRGAVGFFLLAAATVWADSVSCEYTWTGGSGGTWQGANWNGGMAGPLVTYQTVFNLNAPTADVCISSGATVNLVAGPLNSWAGANVLTIAANAQVVIPAYNNGNIGLEIGSTLNNSGDVLVQGAAGLNPGMLWTTRDSTKTTVFTGGGTVTLAGGGLAPSGSSGGSLTLDDQTVRGYGEIAENNLLIQSPSVIDANVSGGTLLLDSGGWSNGVVINNGTMRASNGGVLQLGSGHWSNGPVHITQGAGGVIEALDGSTVQLGYINGDYGDPGSITGGTLTTYGSGHIDAHDSFTLDSVTNTGNIHVLYDGRGNYIGLQLANTINNTGTITLDTAGIGIVPGGATLMGSGTLYLGGNGISGGPLTNASTIQGAGSMTLSSFANLADGVVNANTSGGTLALLGGTYSNAGLMEASNGGTLQLGGDHANIDIVQGAGGVIEALDGSRVYLYSSSITGGTLRSVGTGQLDTSGFTLRDLTLQGTLDVHGAPSGSGTLVVSGAIDNQGTINLSGVSGGAVMATSAAGAVFTGGGTINLTGGGLNGGTFTLNDQTLQGANGIFVSVKDSTFTLGSKGVLKANVNGGTTQLWSDVTNNGGLMLATNGGTLFFNGGTYQGTGGTIQADPGSSVLFVSMHVGGTTNFNGAPGSISANSVTFDNLTMSGNLTSSGSTLTGTFTNTGQLDVLAAGGAGLAFSNASPFTFNGSGTTWFHGVNLGGVSGDGTMAPVINNSNLRGSVSMDLGLAHFTNNGNIYAASGDTIYISGGYGSYGNSYLTNNGTLRVDQGGTMEIGWLANHDESTDTLTGGTYSVAGALMLAENWNPVFIANNGGNIILDGPSAQLLGWYKYGHSTYNALAPNSGIGFGTHTGFVNNLADGSFTLQNGADFTSGGSFTNAGTVNIGSGSTFQVGPTGNLGTYTQTGGSTKLNGTLTAGRLDIEGGTLSGTGTLNAGLLLKGVLSPGNSPGTLIVYGDFEQDASGTLDIEAGMGVADFLDVRGNVTLDGTLDVTAYGVWSGSVSDHFLILDWTGTRSGDFDQILLPTLAGYQFSTQWTDNGLYLNINGDGAGSQTPEPATFFVLASALAVLGAYKLRRAR